jgi:hypothetical protein
MAWGTDLLAGLGGAMQGGLAMHQQQKAEEYRRQRDEQIDDLKKQLAEMKGTQQLEQIEKRNVGKQALQHLVNTGKIDLEKLDQLGDKELDELHQRGLISLEEKMQIGRMSLAERNNAASQKRVETQGEFAQKRVETQGETSRAVANTNAASAGNVATIGAKSREEIEAERQFNLNKRYFEGSLPVNIFRVQTQADAAAQRAGAAATRRGETAPAPKSRQWGQFMQQEYAPPAPAESPGMPPRSLRPPVGQIPLNPPPIGGMSPAPPGGVPVAPQSAAPPAPAPAVPRVAPQLFGPGAGGIAPGVSAPSLGGPGMAPRSAAPAPGFQAQAPAARPNLGEATLAQAGMELGRQIREADKRGDKAAATRLRGELAKLLNPPR